MKRRVLCLFVSVAILLGTFFSITVPISAEVISSNGKLPFKDAVQDSWYYDGALFCYANNIIQGQGNSYTFAPNVKVTRATFVVMLARVAKADTSVYTESQFSDCTASWYTPSVEWAAQMGYVSGTGKGRFSPDKTMTREELATLLTRFMQAQNYNIDIPEGSIGTYSDAEKISKWAVEGMEYLIASGIIGSTSSGKLTASPKMSLTRAQASLVFERFMKGFLYGSCQHNMVSASCTEGEHCSVCKMTTSLPSGHKCDSLSCINEDICKVCKETVAPDEGLHIYTEASCTEAAKCTVCQKTSGQPKGHKFSPATCMTPKTCTVCKISEGEALGHTTENGICMNCGAEFFASGYDKIGYHMTKNGVYSDKSCYIIGRWESYSDHVGYTQISYYDTVSAYVFGYELISYPGKGTLTLQITVPGIGNSYNYTVNYYENDTVIGSASGKLIPAELTSDSLLVFESYSGNTAYKDKIATTAKTALNECLIQSDLLLDGLCGAGVADFNFSNIKWNS